PGQSTRPTRPTGTGCPLSVRGIAPPADAQPRPRGRPRSPVAGPPLPAIAAQLLPPCPRNSLRFVADGPPTPTGTGWCPLRPTGSCPGRGSPAPPAAGAPRTAPRHYPRRPTAGRPQSTPPGPVRRSDRAKGAVPRTPVAGPVAGPAHRADRAVP